MMVSVEILVNEMSMSVKVPASLSNELTHTEHFRVTQNSDYANTTPSSWRDNGQRMEHKRYLLDAMSQPTEDCLLCVMIGKV